MRMAPSMKMRIMFTLITKIFSISCLILIASGCMRVDTNPVALFNGVKADIASLTNQNIYWDPCLSDSVEMISAEELLKKVLTEDFVVQIALLNNQKLQAVYENLGIAKANLVQAGLLKNPIFSFSDRFSTQSVITDLIDMALFQNFLEILLIPLKKKMARAELEATKAMLMTNILDTIAETRIAFYMLQTTEKIWDLKNQILLATELSYVAAQKLFEAGNIKDLQVSMERSYYEQAKLEVASWEIVILESREKLNVLMGLWGRQIDWEISSDSSILPSKEDSFDNIENDSIAHSIDLKIAYNNLKKTASIYGIDTSRLIFPQIDIGMSSERDDSIWFVGPAFNIAIPFFDFGQANSAKAQAVIMQEWNRYTALAVEIRSYARSSRFSTLNAFRQSEYLEKVIVPLAEQITYSTLLQHNAMQIGIFRLLIAKKVELEKKIQSVQMQQEYWISKVKLQTLINGHILGKEMSEGKAIR